MNPAIILIVFGLVSWLVYDVIRWYHRFKTISRYSVATELIFICSEHEHDKRVHELAEWHRECLRLANNELNELPGSWNIQVIEIIFGYAYNAGETWEEFEERKIKKMKEMVNAHHIAMFEYLGEEKYKFIINGQLRAKAFRL